MKIAITSILLLVTIFLTSCAPARVYTFEKDRVDQTVEGNRGYIAGTPPLPESAVKGTPKRELIGLDLEIGLLPSEKQKVKKLEAEERLPEAGLETTRKVFPPEEPEKEEDWIK